jgi:broad specificity phosphatase PhoE
MTKENSLFFIRHGKLLLPYKDHAEMPLEVLADLASSKLNPPIDANFIEVKIPELDSAISLEKISKIYASPSRRCQDTAQFIRKYIIKNYKNNIEVITAPELHEIEFELLKILPTSTSKEFNIRLVNDAVFKAMTEQGESCEYAGDAYKRINDFLRLHSVERMSLFITHDFIMRVIESYIRHKGDPSHKISYEELKNTQRNFYLSGFATDAFFENFISFSSNNLA